MPSEAVDLMDNGFLPSEYLTGEMMVKRVDAEEQSITPGIGAPCPPCVRGAELSAGPEGCASSFEEFVEPQTESQPTPSPGPPVKRPFLKRGQGKRLQATKVLQGKSRIVDTRDSPVVSKRSAKASGRESDGSIEAPHVESSVVNHKPVAAAEVSVRFTARRELKCCVHSFPRTPSCSSSNNSSVRSSRIRRALLDRV